MLAACGLLGLGLLVWSFFLHGPAWLVTAPHWPSADFANHAVKTYERMGPIADGHNDSTGACRGVAKAALGAVHVAVVLAALQRKSLSQSRWLARTGKFGFGIAKLSLCSVQRMAKLAEHITALGDELAKVQTVAVELETEVVDLRKELSEARAAVRISQEAALMATRKLAEVQSLAQEAKAEAEAERESFLAEIKALKESRSEAEAKVAALVRQLRSRDEALAATEAKAMAPQAGFAQTRAGIEAAAAVAEAEQRRTPVGSLRPATDQALVGVRRPEVLLPPGHYWTLPPQRYEFMQERPMTLGRWQGSEQVGEVAKAGKARVCSFYRLPGVVPVDEVARVLEHCVRSEAYVTDPDSVDRTPTFEYYPFQNGQWVDQVMKPLLEDAIETKVLPYIRERYGCPDCAIADILVRRYLPGERRTHAVHFDGHAFVTAVLGLSNPDEYDGGLYVQPGADVASRMFFRIEPGDLVVHSFDLQHGVHVWKGIRYSLIFWIKDSAKAVREHTTPWYDKLAEEGDADALYALALNHSSGSSGKPLDIVRAIELYERSAREGHHFAQNNLGTLYKKAHKVMSLADGLKKSVSWLGAAADAGFAMAQKNLALAYANGEGVERSEAKAAEWMLRAAEQLDVEAAHLLGKMYMEGLGLPRDLVQAAMWYRRSAKAGFPQAQYTLGILHLEGQGVEKDIEKAEAWFHYAAKQGVPEAKNNLAALCAQRGEVGQAARIWAELAAKGEPNAQCNLGMCYMRGVGQELDIKKAREWLEKAAAQGHRMAQSALVQL